MSIRKILEAGIAAPSGDNQQPWKLKADGGGSRIDIFNDPARGASPFNFRERPALIACGALLENIVIASGALGYEPEVTLFPNKNDTNHLALVRLKKTEPSYEPLYPYIEKRATNRKFYHLDPLTRDEKATLLNAADCFAGGGGGEVKLVEGREERTRLAKAVSTQERIVLGNPALHEALFGNIRWSEKEMLRRRTGLFVKTGELSLPQLFVFKLCSNWTILKILSKLKLPEFIARENSKLYASGAAIGIITAKGETPRDFLLSGRIMERLWLEATRMNLSLHPLVAIPYLYQQIAAGEADFLSAAEIRLIEDAYDTIADVFKFQNEIVTFMFRIGRSDAPSARSPRLPLEAVLEEVSETIHVRQGSEVEPEDRD